MKVLVIGNGGREHALAWKAASSTQVEQVFVAPGNAGTQNEANVSNVDIAVDDFSGLAEFAETNAIGLTIVGPEVPLVAGVRDYFDARGLLCFGPSQAASQLEGSKSFTKEFMARHNIPTAAFESFSDVDKAKAYVRSQGAPIVVKADGLAAGKGVVVAQTEQQALVAVEDMLAGNKFGDAGHLVVIEEFIAGEEASFICICDGKTALPFASSQDHKAVLNGDKGANTGGMGAYSPAPVVDQQVHDRAMREVIEPTMRGLAAEGMPYQGFLYAGLMVLADGSIKVIEFNCRFGDPEAQPVMMRLQSDLVDLCLAALAEDLATLTMQWDQRVALGVVMAAGGYPESYAKGAVIAGLATDSAASDLKTFHAGTLMQGDQVTTNGGRVLCVVALGADVAAAQARAYQGVANIHWPDAYHRSDIGYRAIGR